MDGYVNDIRRAIRDCSERGLCAAAKWAGDFLLNIPPDQRPSPAHQPSFSSTDFRTSTPNGSLSARHSIAFPDDLNMAADDEMRIADDLYALEEDLHLAARELFNAKEFERAAHVLRYCKSPKARFLCVYSKFLASEKEALDNWTYRKGSRNYDERPINAELPALLNELSNVNNTAASTNEKDPFLLYLKGVILGALRRRPEATECFVLSVNVYPWNWSCWLQLGAMIEDAEEWAGLYQHLPNHPVTKMLALRILTDINPVPESMDESINELLELFPHSLFVRSQKALLAYHHRDFEEAEAIFDSILEIDPYRIDNLDIFGNILYVQHHRAKLSDLAQRFIRTDKDRPEVCGLIGNYYSLRREHEKAVKYFKRAVQLDPTHLAAWTLMGHEYIEMKNPNAAIEAYRRATDVNRKDYRAWFGLGKTYELLDMSQYSLHYYQRAAALRPYDSRMWVALGACYRTLAKWTEAIECAKRAQSCADGNDVSHYLSLASLYEKTGDVAAAALYHRRIVELCEQQGRHLGEYSKSSVFAARYELDLATSLKGGGIQKVETEPPNLGRARKLLETVAASNVEDAIVAQEMLRKLKTLGG